MAIYQRMQRLGAGLSENTPAYLRQTVVNRSRSVLAAPEGRLTAPVRGGSDEPGADHDASGATAARRVLDALAELPRRQREVLALRYYLDLSEREIAETLRISPGP